MSDSNDVHAPYHFVPLSKWVYMPDWAHLVSHDVPFKNGYSGIINYTLTNINPLCVGDAKDKNNLLKFVRNPDGQPIIPGSSLKGMIRNVLEIASFGKFSFVDRQRFSYRDISKGSHYLKDVIKPNNVVSGWLKYNSELSRWQFRECQCAKVHHDEINSSLKKIITNDMPVEEKYRKLPLNQAYSANISDPRGVQKNRWAEELNKGDTNGYFVFTNMRIIGKQSQSNDYEFSYFFSKPFEAVKFDNIQSEVNNLFVNHNAAQVKYLRNHNNKMYGIPVFALVKKNEASRLHSLGFAKMPRVSYDFDTIDLVENINKAHQSEAYFDMAELMFGTLRDDGFGLKSRVIFADAVIDKKSYDSKNMYKATPTVLESPKATFLGGYLQQNDPTRYSSYDDKNALLSGWKRYPVKKDYEHYKPSNNNTNVLSYFELLKPNNIFNGKVVFHNLTKEELSALVWCMTLANSPDNFHILGYAKPLGAGAVSIKIDDKNSILKPNLGTTAEKFNTHILADYFSEHMNTRFDPQGKWESSPQIQHLMALTNKKIANSNCFYYLDLKEYQRIKGNKGALEPLKFNEEPLSTKENINPSGSLAFCKGRLSSLFDDSSDYYIEQVKESNKHADRTKHLLKKAKEASEKEKLINEDLPPFEKNFKLLEFIVQTQRDLSSTEKNKKKKELRNIIKSLKEIVLTSSQVSDILSVLLKVNFAPKEVEKGKKYLENYTG